MMIKISLMQTENNLGRQRHCIDHPSHRPTLCWAIATSKKRWRGPRGKTWKFKSENSAQVSSTLYSVWFILHACLSSVSDIVIHCPSSSYLVSYWMNSISSANLPSCLVPFRHWLQLSHPAVSSVDWFLHPSSLACWVSACLVLGPIEAALGRPPLVPRQTFHCWIINIRPFTTTTLTYMSVCWWWSVIIIIDHFDNKIMAI